MSKRLGIVIDQERCMGCEACTVACRIENHTAGPWICVETQNVRRKDTPEGRFPALSMHFLPRLCQHCAHPPCVDACPAEALVKRPDGAVVLDEDKCDACQLCLEACPYQAILYNTEKNMIEKCNLCRHRIDEGLEPFCVICCEGQAMYFGDLNDPKSEVSKIICNRETFQLQPSAGTGPSVYYCRPRASKWV